MPRKSRPTDAAAVAQIFDGIDDNLPSNCL